jgi:hypothetical protein
VHVLHPVGNKAWPRECKMGEIVSVMFLNLIDCDKYVTGIVYNGYKLNKIFIKYRYIMKWMHVHSGGRVE